MYVSVYICIILLEITNSTGGGQRQEIWEFEELTAPELEKGAVEVCSQEIVQNGFVSHTLS